MTGSAIRAVNTNLLSGNAIDVELFYQLLNLKKNMLEMSRDWMILRTFDSSITFSASDDYTSTKSLPSRFLRVYNPFSDNRQEQTGVYIVDSAGNKNALKPIKFAERYNYKDTDGFYYLDIKNNKIGRTGTLTGTLHLFFLQGTADFSIEDEDTEFTTAWPFPGFAQFLLPYEIAIEQKGGIDWDRVNASQIPFNRDTVTKIMADLAMWDARLQQAELGV